MKIKLSIWLVIIWYLALLVSCEGNSGTVNKILIAKDSIEEVATNEASYFEPIHSDLGDGIWEITLYGEITEDTVVFHIYLPPSYSNTDKKYSVVYQLHGIGGGLGINQENLVPELYSSAADSNIIDEVIIVFPDGYGNSMWANSATTNKPAETNVIHEIVPYVDEQFRTIPDRSHRIMQGFSMGGYGAALYATKYPEFFSQCIIYDGALHNWETLTTKRADIASEIFANDPSIFDEYSPWFQATKNAEILKDSVCFQIIKGALSYNLAYYDHMRSLGIPVEYVETICGHQLGFLIDEEGIASISYVVQCGQ